MEITASTFYAHHRHRAIAFVLMTEVLLCILAGASAWVAWLATQPDALPAFCLGVLGLVIMQIIAVPLMLRHINRPLSVLSQAVAHVSKDLLQTPPPDISSPRYEATGLKAMVQTVYELAAGVAAGPSVNTRTSEESAAHRTIADNAPCGIVALDGEGRVIYHNAAAPIAQGADSKPAVSLQFEPNDSLQHWLQTVGDKVRDTHTWLRIGDKTPGEEGRRIYDIVARYTKGGADGIETVLITVDRTAIYAPDEESMDFIALAAHELRGPITVIRGYLDLLEDELSGKLQADQQVLIDRLHVSSERLSGYINNILNVSRYDRHHLTLHLHEEHLLDIIKTLVPDLALRAKTQNRRLTFTIPETLPPIAADRSSLGEVLSNLIDNAIKYSHDGGEVKVSANTKDDFIEITVQDSGIGIPESIVGNLFGKFYRSHRSRQQVDGTGLGLYICKAIVQSHGGTIWVRSHENEGALFGFTIPTYASVADKLDAGDNSTIIERSEGWIKNHSMVRK